MMTTLEPTRRRPAIGPLIDRHLPALGFLSLLALWESVVRLLDVSDMIAPAPSAIAESLYQGFASGIYLPHLLVTATQCVAGFAAALVAGVILGSLIAEVELIERMVYPLVVAFQSMPKIALAPIIIVLFGYGPESKIVLGALLATFPMLVSQVTGLRHCEQGKIDIMRSLSASRWQVFRLVKFPNALPHLFAGMKIASVFVVLGVVTGEFLGAKLGLGTLILLATGDIATARVFSILVLLGLLGFGMHTAASLAQKHVVRWASAPTGIVAEGS